MRNYPTLEPVVVDGGSFVIERMLDRPGEVVVGVGDVLTPESVVARSEDIEKSITLYVANELAVENDGLNRYLAKSIGSSIHRGEVLARVRRGLRTATVRSPVDGEVIGVDESSGTVIVSSPTEPKELHALVHGTVDQVVHGSGITLRTEGIRVYGIIGFGDEAIGPLVVGIDRNDRELTPDHVSDNWAGAIVLAGMTLGVPALSKLLDVGAAGVIVGSISESDIRRFLSPRESGDTMRSAEFWGANQRADGYFAHPDLESEIVIVVTEGFGRRAMAPQVFDLLSRNEGESISMSAETVVGERLTRPEIYLTSGGVESSSRFTDDLTVGRAVRIVDPSPVGLTAICDSEPFVNVNEIGYSRMVTRVSLRSGDRRTIPTANLEVLS